MFHWFFVCVFWRHMSENFAIIYLRRFHLCFLLWFYDIITCFYVLKPFWIYFSFIVGGYVTSSLLIFNCPSFSIPTCRRHCLSSVECTCLVFKLIDIQCVNYFLGPSSILLVWIFFGANTTLGFFYVYFIALSLFITLH